MAVVASIVDVGGLLEVVWTSLVAGVGICAIFSVAIVGFARALDMRHAGQAAAAAAYWALTAAGIVGVLAAVAFGVLVMTSK